MRHYIIIDDGDKIVDKKLSPTFMSSTKTPISL